MMKTPAKYLLAIAVLVSMVVSMALPASAASYKLKLEIFDSTNSDTQGNILETETEVADGTNLSDALLELILANFSDLAEGPWEIEIGGMSFDQLIEEGMQIESDQWDEWLSGFEDDVTGIEGGANLLALLKNNVTVGSMEDGSYSMTYTPVVEDGTDPADVKSFTFVLTRDMVTIGGGGDDVPPTITDPEDDKTDVPGDSGDDSGDDSGSGGTGSGSGTGTGSGGLRPSGGGGSSSGGASIPPLPPVVPALDTSSAESWAVNWLNRANSLNLLSARNRTQFTKDVTRLQFADLAVTLAEQLTGKIILPVESTAFTDTTDVMILKAKAAGIAGGYQNEATGTFEFRPNNPITREEICVMLAHVVEYVTAQLGPFSGWDQSETIKGSFPDLNKVESWAVKQVALMANNDIMSGRATETGALLTPKANTALQEAITLAVKIFDKNG